jgi:hypothetical protein
VTPVVGGPPPGASPLTVVGRAVEVGAVGASFGAATVRPEVEAASPVGLGDARLATGGPAGPAARRAGSFARPLPTRLNSAW